MNNRYQTINDLEIDYIYKVLYNFKFKRHKRTYSKRHCPICFSYIKKNNVVLNCTHNFCFHCFDKFIVTIYKNHNIPICFICRQDIISLEVKQDEHMKKIQNLILSPEDDKKIMTYYPNLSRIPNKKVLYKILLYTFFFYLLLYTYEFVKGQLLS